MLKSVNSCGVNFVSQRIPCCLLDNKEGTWLNPCLPSSVSVKYFHWGQQRAGEGSLEPTVRISSNSMVSDQWSHLGSLEAVTMGEFIPQALVETKSWVLSSPQHPKSQLLKFTTTPLPGSSARISMFRYESIVSPPIPPFHSRLLLHSS